MDTINNDGRKRVIIKDVSPEIDSGRFPIKRTVGENVVVEADIFTDGHDALSCEILYRNNNQRDWEQAAMTFLNNDRWRGEFTVTELTICRYSVRGWIDKFKSWKNGLNKKVKTDHPQSAPIL